ncbi:MAG: arsenic efflux protein [Clostridia bacterium]|nr:arsenic efflux protein [Clostridia bacterium]
MEMFLHVLLHSLIDTAKLLPFLVIVYFLIEFLEYKNIFKFESSKLLKGKYSPAVGALFGSVPQCGFSVISSELYAKRKVSVGALIAVFIATSDEALPIMISNYKSIPSLLMLVLVKVIMAISVGYITMLLYSKIFKHNHAPENNSEEHDDHHEEHDEEHEKEAHENGEHHHVHACCNHEFKGQKYNWKHPLVHCIKITLYIFVVNVVMGLIVELVGEDNLSSFLKSSSAFQPLLALVIGLIPNCASSVILTELYLMGGLSFGAIVAGLSVNAGLGLMILFKENKNIKENLFIVACLVVSSLVFGYALHFLPLGFLLI